MIKRWCLVALIMLIGACITCCMSMYGWYDRNALTTTLVILHLCYRVHVTFICGCGTVLLDRVGTISLIRPVLWHTRIYIYILEGGGNCKRHVQKNVSVALRSWWDSDKIETIVDPVQHSAIALSVSLEVSGQYLFKNIYFKCGFNNFFDTRVMDTFISLPIAH